MARILVTGSAGYLGAEVVRAAVVAGHEAVGTWYRRPVDGGVQLDVRDRDGVQVALAEVRPDAVVHAAFVQDGPDLWPITAEAPGILAAATAEGGVRLVHISTDVVFDGELDPGLRYVETDGTAPVHAYGEAKAAAERLVDGANPAAAIARVALIVGGPAPNRQERLVADALAGAADVTFFTDEVRTPVEVGDLARAMVELAGNDWSGPLHLGGEDALSRYELAALIAGPAAGRLRSARSADAPGRRPRNCSLDSSLARSVLSTRLRGVREVFG
ncbi:MAG: SDR family oxidoreductase [Actinomycetota bacterium]